MNTVLVYITAENSAEALRIGRVLVEEKLAACANVLDGMIEKVILEVHFFTSYI